MKLRTRHRRSAGFLQTVPLEGEPATERTDAWVFYDDDNIYLVCRCWDSAPPEEWIANEMRRDTHRACGRTTFFGGLFDTFHDRRSGFNFYTNPLAARADQWITDEGNAELVTGTRSGPSVPAASRAAGRRRWRFRSSRSGTFPVRTRPGGSRFGAAIRRKNEFAYLTFVPASTGWHVEPLHASPPQQIWSASTCLRRGGTSKSSRTRPRG